MYVVIHCTDRADGQDMRTALLPPHIDYVESHRDIIIWAGARLNSDGTSVIGSFFVLNVLDQTVANSFSANDPFTRGGLFQRVEISRVRRGIFRPDLAEE